MPDILPSDCKSKYIVKFKDASSVAKASSFVKAQAAQVSPITLASISSSQGIEPDQLTYGISAVYNSTFLSGMAVTLSEEDIKKLKKRYGDKIEYIEPDLNVYPTGVQQDAPWGLARIGRWDTSGSNSYQYPDAAGEGVDVYILDTGLTPNHPSFGGRATFLRSFVPNQGGTDVKGHGTHVAGTVGSSRYGVAKKARIFGVKVLGDRIEDGTYSSVIEGIQLVTSRARPGKTVINMSLAGAKAQIMEDAVAAARKAGVVVVAAAGNDRADACNYGPASSSHVITVGATDQNDNTAFFSNYGGCVDIFAPGVGIYSLGTRGNDDAVSMQGTSMAAPHVAGIAALYMSMKNYKNADDVVKDILGWSRRCVRGAAQGSGIGLVYANPNLK